MVLETNLPLLVEKIGMLRTSQRELLCDIASGLSITDIASKRRVNPQAIYSSMTIIYNNLGLTKDLGNIFRKKAITEAWKSYSKLSEKSAEILEPVPGEDTPSRDDSKSHAPIASGSDSLTALSIGLASPQQILSVKIITAEDGNFEEACKRLIALGYFPEILNEYQSTTNLAVSISRIVFVKRR